MSSNPSSILVKKEPCPKCRAEGKDKAGDNLAIYEDGHAYCYSCHYRIPSDAVKMLEASANYLYGKLKEQPDGTIILEKVKPKGIRLPDGSTDIIDIKALTWLHKYGIMINEVKDNELLWNAFRKWLIFPYRGAKGELLCFQARAFNQNDIDTGRKWLTFGNHSGVIHLVGEVTDTIVVVEDIVSAIKVGRHMQAMPLFGSQFGLQRLQALRHLTKKLVFWLDSDKYVSAIKYAKAANNVGVETRCVYTEKDPKKYDDETIRAILGD